MGCAMVASSRVHMQGKSALGISLSATAMCAAQSLTLSGREEQMDAMTEALTFKEKHLQLQQEHEVWFVPLLWGVWDMGVLILQLTTCR